VLLTAALPPPGSEECGPRRQVANDDQPDNGHG